MPQPTSNVTSSTTLHAAHQVALRLPPESSHREGSKVRGRQLCKTMAGPRASEKIVLLGLELFAGPNILYPILCVLHRVLLKQNV